MKTIVNIRYLSPAINQFSVSNNWSAGADGNGGNVDPISFLILEEIYNILNCRPQWSSIKFFKNVSDKLAYEWHADRDNPTETLITSSVLVYLPDCENSTIEFSDHVYTATPYDVVIFDSSTLHRAGGNQHGPVLKYTFL